MYFYFVPVHTRLCQQITAHQHLSNSYFVIIAEIDDDNLP